MSTLIIRGHKLQLAGLKTNSVVLQDLEHYRFFFTQSLGVTFTGKVQREYPLYVHRQTLRDHHHRSQIIGIDYRTIVECWNNYAFLLHRQKFSRKITLRRLSCKILMVIFCLMLLNFYCSKFCMNNIFAYIFTFLFYFMSYGNVDVIICVVYGQRSPNR